MITNLYVNPLDPLSRSLAGRATHSFAVLLSAAVLRIYRRRDHPGDLLREGPDHGVFIKDIGLNDLWPLDKALALTVWTDESPQWFVGGNLDFTPDSREMIVTARWGNVVRIRLKDGSLKDR